MHSDNSAFPWSPLCDPSNGENGEKGDVRKFVTAAAPGGPWESPRGTEPSGCRVSSAFCVQTGSLLAMFWGRELCKGFVCLFVCFVLFFLVENLNFPI